MAYEGYRPDTTSRHPPTRPNYSYDTAPQHPHPSHTTYTHPLKPISQNTTTTTTSPSAPSYAPLAARTTDTQTKRLIRRLKLASRLLAFALSLATFIPLALTLHKFLTTRDETLVVQGEERTAWASGTEAWYTYLYFSVAGVSLVLNAGVLGAYCCGGVGRANRVAEVEGWWASVQRGGEVVGWIVSVVIYRYGREPDVDGKFKVSTPRSCREDGDLPCFWPRARGRMQSSA